MRIAFGMVMAALTAAAASGQVVSLEHFCDEPRKRMIDAKATDEEAARLRTMKSDLERAIKQAKASPQTETAIASRMAKLRVDLLAAQQIAEFDWNAFDRELAPIVHRWAIAAGDTKTTDRYVDVFNILHEIKLRKDVYFARAKVAYTENQKPLPPEPWSEDQIRTIAKNRAEEKVALAGSSMCEFVYGKLDDSSGLRPFALPPDTDDAAIVRKIRGTREGRDQAALERAKFAVEIGELSEEKLEERLAQVNERFEALPKTGGARSRRGDTGETDRIRKEFVEAFTTKGLVRDNATLADGSEARSERTEGKDGRISYLVHHKGAAGERSYLATIRCSCETVDAYLPELGLKKPIAGTKGLLMVRDNFQTIWIITPNVVIEMTPAPGSPAYEEPPFKLSDEEKASPAGKALDAVFRSQQRAKKPEPLTPQVVEDVVKAVFAVERM